MKHKQISPPAIPHKRLLCRVLIVAILFAPLSGCRPVLLIARAIGKIFTKGGQAETPPANEAATGQPNAPAVNQPLENIHPQLPVTPQVLPADTKELEVPLRPREGAPRITLENVRTKSPTAGTFERPELIFDFRREGNVPPKATFKIHLKSKENRSILNTFLNDPLQEKTSGTIRVPDNSLQFGFADRSTPSIANIPLTVWVEMTEDWHKHLITQQVSNSITLNGGTHLWPREWKDFEKNSYNLFLKWQTPLQLPPDGYTVASASTKLIPGLPILEAFSHEWLPSEVLEARPDGQVLISTKDRRGNLFLHNREWIAVQDSVLKEAAANPTKFKPSLRVIPGGSVPIPADSLIVDKNTKIFPGMDVQIESGLSWVTGIVESLPDATHALILRPNSTESPQSHPRDSLIIKAETARLLEQPGIEEKLAARLQRVRSGKSDHDFDRADHDDLKPLPDGVVLLPDGIELKPGTTLQIKSHLNWEDVEFIDKDWDGRVRIRTTGNLPKEGPIDRDLLVISSYELARLTGKSSTPDAPSNTSAPLQGQWIPVLPDMPLYPGVPVRAEDTFGRNSDASVTEVLDDDNVEIKTESFSSRGESKHRSKLLIERRVAAVLRQPGIAERFAYRLSRMDSLHKPVVYSKADVAIRLPIPSNAVRVSKETPLQPGTKLGINSRDFRGKDRWWDVTVLGLNWDDTVHIHIEGESESKDGDVERDCLIIAKSDLQKLQKQSSASAESPDAAPSGSNSTSKQSESKTLLSVDFNTPLLPGAPVLVKYFNDWTNATVIQTFEDDKITILRDSRAGSDDFQHLRLADLKIRPHVLEALKVPENEEKFAARAEHIKLGTMGHSYPAAEYRVRDPLPKDALRVMKETPLTVGTRLGLFYGRAWHDVIVTELNWDDSVRIHVDREDSKYDGNVDRSCLIISKAELQKLEAAAEPEKPGKSPAP